ncbi:hypothetical protein ACT3SZ_07640 [Corynebacterium sp. AOP40-9SA-29]|uniref:hypothetical protein n=1 Tax=Corynebacterium sp. AOP40-9SA-29 TaxID=3457677 RepID=UPI004034BDE6
MATQNTTTSIRYYKARASHGSASNVSMRKQFWDAIIQGLAANPMGTLSIKNEIYEVGVFTGHNSLDLLYFGKRRTGPKAPMVSDTSTQTQTLESIKLSKGQEIVEAGIIRPVQNSPRGIVGMFRTANGPTPSAIGQILDEIIKHVGYSTKDHKFVPIAGDNLHSVLSSANEVSKLEIGIEKGVKATSISGKDPVSQATASVISNYGAQIAVDISVSYGGVGQIPNHGFLNSLRSLFGDGVAKKMKATTRTQKADGSGGYEIDHVDLIKDYVVLEMPVNTASNRISVKEISDTLDAAEVKLHRKANENPPRITL